MDTLAGLTDPATKGAIVVTSVNALVQKLPPRDVVAGMSFAAKAGNVVDSERLIAWAANNGYLRVPTVREAGEYAVRGGLVDLYAAGTEAPLRFDFFGTTLETIRSFDPETQRTTGSLADITLSPMSEVMLTPDTIRHFRGRYTATFGGQHRRGPALRRDQRGPALPGHGALAAVLLRPPRPVEGLHRNGEFVFDDQADLALKDRQEQIADYFEARESARTGDKAAGATVYKPIPAETLYETDAELADLAGGSGIVLTPFANDADVENAGGRMPPSFAAERKAADTNLFESVVSLLKSRGKAGHRTVVAAWSEGTRERLMQLLADHGLDRTKKAESWRDAEMTSPGHGRVRRARTRDRFRNRRAARPQRTGHSGDDASFATPSARRPRTP